MGAGHGRVERGPWVSLKTGRQLSQTLGEDRRGPDIFPKGFSSIQVYPFFLWNSLLTSWRPRSEPALCGGVKRRGDWVRQSRLDVQSSQEDQKW